MGKVKGFILPQRYRLTESETGQKLDAPEFHSGGKKKSRNQYLIRNIAINVVPTFTRTC